MATTLKCVIVLGALLMAIPATASLQIDDFSAGQFNLQAPRTDSQNCPMYCLSGVRGTVVLSNSNGVMSSRLVAPPGEAEVVVDGSGGRFFLIYEHAPGQTTDLSGFGGIAEIEIWLTAFEPGARLSVALRDERDDFVSHSIFPSFAAPPTALNPGIAAIPLSSFVTVDLSRVTEFTFSLNSQAEGVYAITLIIVADTPPDTLTTYGGVDTIGPAYPTVPKINMEWSSIAGLAPAVAVQLGLDDVQDDTGIQVGAGVQAIPGDTATFFETTVATPVTNPTIEYRFDFAAVESMSPIPPEIGPVDWSAGQDYAAVTADLPVDGGVWHWRLFMETNQPVNLVGVTAVPGSALVTVQISGDVDVGSPVLDMAMAANFLPSPSVAVPGLADPWALVVLVLTLIATGVWFDRVRAGASSP